jgi:aminomethyltransferase
MDINSNPLELPLGNFCQLDKEAEYLSRKALHKIRTEGVTKKLVGLVVDGDPFISGCASPWKVMSNNKICGKVSSAAYSPRLKINMAMATIDNGFNEIDTEVKVETPWGIRSSKVTSIPFN